MKVRLFLSLGSAWEVPEPGGGETAGREPLTLQWQRQQ